MTTSESSLPLPLEDRALHEQKRASFAPTFDRLVSSNLDLSHQVGLLVRVSVVALGVQMLTLSVLAYAVLMR